MHKDRAYCCTIIGNCLHGFWKKSYENSIKCASLLTWKRFLDVWLPMFMAMVITPNSHVHSHFVINDATTIRLFWTVLISRLKNLWGNNSNNYQLLSWCKNAPYNLSLETFEKQHHVHALSFITIFSIS